MNPIRPLIVDQDYPWQLLHAAKEMTEAGRFEIAVVTSQMACEIKIERVFRAYFKHRALAYVEAAIEDLLPSYNLSSDKVRKLYSSLTGDAIQHEHFWSEYKAMVSLRNKAVHAGARLQESQAQMVTATAERVLRHLERIERRAPEFSK